MSQLEVGPNGFWMVQEQDQVPFEKIVEINESTAALSASMIDAQAQILKLQERIKTLKKLKSELEDTKSDLEFKIFPKYGMQRGQPFSITDWEITGVGPGAGKKEPVPDVQPE